MKYEDPKLEVYDVDLVWTGLTSGGSGDNSEDEELGLTPASF